LSTTTEDLRAAKVRRYAELDAVLNVTHSFSNMFRGEGIVADDAWKHEAVDPEAEANALLEELWPNEEDMETDEHAAMYRECELITARLLIHAARHPEYFAQDADRFIVLAQGRGDS
jgi:hypothetical protein